MITYQTKINRYQKLMTASQWKQCCKQAKARDSKVNQPVVKFFNPRGAQTWLISEVDEDGIAFGLCDLGFGEPELGSVSLEEMVSIGYIERDLYFKANKALIEYANEANACRRIKA